MPLSRDLFVTALALAIIATLYLYSFRDLVAS